MSCRLGCFSNFFYIYFLGFLDLPLSLQAGVIEEIVNDAVDTALDSEDIEEETEEEVDKVLTEIAGETASQLPQAVQKEKTKLPAQTASTSRQVCKHDFLFQLLCMNIARNCKELNSVVSFLQEEAIAEGVDDEEELEELRARLANVRS